MTVTLRKDGHLKISGFLKKLQCLLAMEYYSATKIKY